MNKKIVICGSFGASFEEMCKLKDLLSTYDGISCIVPTPLEKGENLIDHYKKWLRIMDDADLVIFVKKPDGSLGEATSYEFAYCMNRDIRLVTGAYENLVNFIKDQGLGYLFFLSLFSTWSDEEVKEMLDLGRSIAHE